MKRNKAIIIAIVATIILSCFYHKNRKQKEFDNTLKEIKEERIKYRGNVLTKKTYTKDEIALTAQKYVEQNLKAPSTAKFPTLFKSSITKNSWGTYSVSSYVDSHNGFGAMIRSNYFVEMKQSADGSISLVNINISE